MWVSGEGRNAEVIGGGRDGCRKTCSERISKVEQWQFLGMVELVLILI